MAQYIITGNYTSAAIKGLIAHPSDREAARVPDRRLRRQAAVLLVTTGEPTSDVVEADVVRADVRHDGRSATGSSQPQDGAGLHRRNSWRADGRRDRLALSAPADRPRRPASAPAGRSRQIRPMIFRYCILYVPDVPHDGLLHPRLRPRPAVPARNDTCANWRPCRPACFSGSGADGPARQGRGDEPPANRPSNAFETPTGGALDRALAAGAVRVQGVKLMDWARPRLCPHPRGHAGGPVRRSRRAA